ncbi:MAG: PTS sugar transporter subunit IIC/EAL domain-containing protein [Abditibacteriota bacterium]|nr:PTS sugar transporter subunit IIC/EAL domain-containing protein [Abditibacteriota bacterium]
MNHFNRFNRLIRRIEQMTVVRAVRNALVNMIPVLTIGAFALILLTLPVPAYQRFLETDAGGLFFRFLRLVYSGTFGVLSVYITILISYAYVRLRADKHGSVVGAILAAVICFAILAGAYLPDFSIDYLGPKSMFLALLTGLGASSLCHWLYRKLRRDSPRVLTVGADLEFTRALSTLAPIAITVVVFATLNGLIIRLAHVDSFLHGLNSLFNWAFSFGEVGFFKGLCMVLLSSLLWFFGIHGSDTLEGVMQTYFTPGLAANQAAVAAGGEPQVILTKGFFDLFVLMGGCGATICLLIAITLFSRSRARKRLGLYAALPMIFNINEMMVFGLPIILNPVMFVPFITVPLVCFTATYVAIYCGFVPMITSEVEWTTPVLLGGYYATGSIAGSLLQLFNILLGVLIYLPFVKILDHQSEARLRHEYDSFVRFFKANEQTLTSVRLTDMNNVYGDLAKELCAEMQGSIGSSIVMGYQPQYNYEGKCVGAESLLRWQHPVLGVLYPPLVIRLAEEGGFLPELEEAVLSRILEEHPAALKRFGEDAKISFNITGKTVVEPRFLQYCAQMDEKYGFRGKNLCLEVTEQAALSFGEHTVRALRTLHGMGLMLAVDDFSMGQTSIHYLKDNLFDLIKLDGSLVRGLYTHQNNREIISSIVRLATTLGLAVLAEFVETEDQRDTLHGLGCDLYQGYLYSPAVFLEDDRP